jgi:sucrose-6-phosphate hydrolase SacC (GH32 family)
MLETSLKGYNIYRGDLKVASEITQTTFTDAGFDTFAAQTWEVKTVCLNGESNPVSATMPACDTVQTVTDRTNPTSFTLYPNPVNNLLKVARTTTGKAQLEIYASDGALVMTQTLDLHDEILNINVTSLSAGIYMVLLKNGSGISTQRFIKQ